MQNVHFTPARIARMLGVNPSTVKRWVDRGMLRAVVTPGGHRRITAEHLASFVRRTPSLAAHSYVLRRNLREGVGSDVWRGYFDAVRAGDGIRAERLLEGRLLRGAPVRTVLEEVVVPTLAHVGTEWSSGRLSVFEEHRISFLIRQHLFRLGTLLPDPNPRAPTALLACVDGEHHEIPLQMLALFLKARRWRAEVLGISTPATAVLRGIRSLRPRLVCLSKTYAQRSHVTYLNTVARAAQTAGAHVAVGGAGWGPALAERIRTGRTLLRHFPDLGSFEAYLRLLQRERAR